MDSKGTPPPRRRLAAVRKMRVLATHAFSGPPPGAAGRCLARFPACARIRAQEVSEHLMLAIFLSRRLGGRPPLDPPGAAWRRPRGGVWVSWLTHVYVCG